MQQLAKLQHTRRVKVSFLELMRLNERLTDKDSQNNQMMWNPTGFGISTYYVLDFQKTIWWTE